MDIQPGLRSGQEFSCLRSSGVSFPPFHAGCPSPCPLSPCDPRQLLVPGSWFSQDPPGCPESGCFWETPSLLAYLQGFSLPALPRTSPGKSRGRAVGSRQRDLEWPAWPCSLQMNPWVLCGERLLGRRWGKRQRADTREASPGWLRRGGGEEADSGFWEGEWTGPNRLAVRWAQRVGLGRMPPVMAGAGGWHAWCGCGVLEELWQV